MKTPEEIIKTILNNRGIKTPQDTAEFLSDRPQKTYDPFLLLNMEEGVDLLLSEIKSGHRICIYGDYDADGVTSICILYRVLGMLTDNLTYYIPLREKEGYGLNKAAVKKIYEDGTDLIITVDCGSVSYDEVEYAKELGLKVIVTDHHRIDGVKADCILINQKQPGCPYPFKELAGCGVAFKMVQALSRRLDLPKDVINDVLDMAALGTVADIVSLTDENRTIVKYGLRRINSGRRRSLSRLIDGISLDKVTSEHISFGIAPHINAAGRMASASEAVELFLSTDERVIDEKVAKLIGYNAERKKKQNSAYEECMKMITGDEQFIVLDIYDIHEGVAGIVAGKIKETEGKPVIIVTPSGEGRLKGTGRSIEKIDIFAMLKKHEHLFERFGGHSSACGFMMKAGNLSELRRLLDEDIGKLRDQDPHLLEKHIAWDMIIDPGEADLDLAIMLEKLQPFGQGNPKPVFRMCDVVPGDVRFLGSDETHASFRAVSSSGGSADCILFRKAQDMKDILLSGNPVDINGKINIKEWKGRKSVQIVVEEITG